MYYQAIFLSDNKLVMHVTIIIHMHIHISATRRLLLNTIRMYVISNLNKYPWRCLILHDFAWI